jgi:hypothetical protein
VIVLADCGNTCIKLRVLGAAGGERLSPDEAARRVSAMTGELIVLPGSAASAALLRDAWRGRLREVGRDLPLPDLGQYPGMGSDRVLAGFAAGPACIVIDAGTATTLSAWDDDGRCAGGLILAGPEAMLAGLRASAPALPATEARVDGPAAQRDTRGAMALGAGLGHQDMVAGCLARLRRETGQARLVLTGGGAARLHLPGAQARPWLVLDGLQRLVE